MGLFKPYQTNQQKELEGVPVICGDTNEDGSMPTFIIARACKSNIRYTKALERETRPYKRLIESDRLSNATALQVQRRVFVQTLLMGWENVFDEKEKPIPFNQENAIMLFDKLPDLYDELATSSQKQSLYLETTLEEDAKN
jgi:hypothetical protein